MRISIAMATYKGERFLREQLDSIARQTLPPFELVITDDSPDSRTCDVALEFARRVSFPVRVYRNERRLAGSATVCSAARGFIARPRPRSGVQERCCACSFPVRTVHRITEGLGLAPC